MKIIEILIDSGGQASLQTKGFSGAACREASQLVEQALGSQIREELTSEFHESAPAANLQHEQGA